MSIYTEIKEIRKDIIEFPLQTTLILLLTAMFFVAVKYVKNLFDNLPISAIAVQKATKLDDIYSFEEVTHLLEEVLLVTNANRVWILKCYVPEYLPHWLYGKVKMVNEVTNNAETTAEFWNAGDGREIGFLNGYAKEIFEKEFYLIYVHPEKYSELVFPSQEDISKFPLFKHEMARQKTDVMLMALTKEKQNPHLVIGIDYCTYNMPETEQLLKATQHLEHLANILQRY